MLPVWRALCAARCILPVGCSAAFRKRNVHTLIASLYAKLALSDELVVDALLR